MDSVYTNSVARAYFLLPDGVDGAGDGGKFCCLPRRLVVLLTVPLSIEKFGLSFGDAIVVIVGDL